MTWNTYVSGITGPNGMGGRMIISEVKPVLMNNFYEVVDKEGILWYINRTHVAMIGTDDYPPQKRYKDKPVVEFVRSEEGDGDGAGDARWPTDGRCARAAPIAQAYPATTACGITSAT